ncbi:NirA family protein [Luteolibacter sp. AS25]|uniref:NirA family protein n=1 Tax=Luteolibacter sp. AS25 TaxID=3135776 RepID=UPI00398B78B6
MVDLNTTAFTPEQTNYLNGFVSGILQGRQIPFLGQDSERRFTDDPDESVETVYGIPIDELCREEVIKHEQNGLDVFPSMLENAGKNVFPSAEDAFRYKFHGLFHVAPAQDSFMMRCRVAGGALSTGQFRGLSKIAETYGPGHTDLTTRNNLQVRELMPGDLPNVLDDVADLGLTSQGSGADNIRNVTATPTTGFDPDELLDVLPYARAMHYYILRNRDLYGLPRKFNIAFDSGGRVSACADTNDIAFYAVRAQNGEIGFRLQLCGITGHKQFATDAGIFLTLSQAIPTAAAILRVFIENGNRTNRKKSRLKYLVDDWGIPKLLQETEKKLAFPLAFTPLESCKVPTPKVKHGHLGIHNQSDGKDYIGVHVPVGRMTCRQMNDIADIADKYGRGEIRLTVWQNLIIPGVSSENVEAAAAAIIATGLDYRPHHIHSGIIACTGSRGCKYAAADTKGNAVDLAAYLSEKLELDQPLNIHLTGCHNSCAQHYIGDIGLMGSPVKNEAGETVDGYNIVLGGGVDDEQAIAREVWKSIPFTDIPALLEKLLSHYLVTREPGESFIKFSNRQPLEDLVALNS